jgi:hypothetical protein
MNLINNLPVAGRILGLFGDLSSDELDTSTKALKAITGIQAKEFNFSAEEDRKQKELMTKLESLLEDAGVRGKFTRFYTKKNTTQISD